MFESAEIGHTLKKSEYKREEPKLRQALLKAQYDLLDHGTFQLTGDKKMRDRSLVVLFEGMDAAGVTVIQKLCDYIESHL